MADDKKIKGKTDRARINVSEQYEVQYWADKFGVSRKELEQAVREVGSNSKDVAATFKKAKAR